MNVDEWDGSGALPCLYSKTSTGAINVWWCWVEGPDVCVRWGQQGGAMQEAQFRCEPKNVGRSNATTAEDQAIKEAIAKWKKQVKKKYFTSLGDAQTKRNFKPMLAKPLKDANKIRFPAYIQPKLNGVRCLAFRKDGKITLMSRGGDPYTVHHIMDQLDPVVAEGEVLDGELYHHGSKLQTIVSWVKTPQEASGNLSLHVYDRYLESAPNMSFEQRLAYMFTQRVAWPSHVPMLDTYMIHRPDEVKSYHDYFVSAGYEGAIVRLFDGTYRFGHRSSALLKVKSFMDDEFIVVGWTVGKGKFANVPIFSCETKDKKNTFEVVPLGTQEERMKMLGEAATYIGRPMTVRFLEYTEGGVPFNAWGVGIREPGT